MSSRRIVAVLVLMATAPACTHWGSTTAYGPRREVGRRLLGAPQIAQTSSSSMSAGFAGASATSPDGRRTGTVAGLSGSSGSMTRTHCIQEAEIDYEQPYQIVARVEGRPLDVAGGVALGFLGLAVMVGASQRGDTVFEPGDPFYEEPPSATPGLLLGGAMVAGGIGTIWYSYSKLPKGPPPAARPQLRTWTSTEFVEATGCGLVPADQPGLRPVRPADPPRPPVTDPAPASGDIAARLKKLDELRAAGLITEAEYQQKRKALIDQL